MPSWCTNSICESSVTWAAFAKRSCAADAYAFRDHPSIQKKKRLSFHARLLDVGFLRLPGAQISPAKKLTQAAYLVKMGKGRELRESGGREKGGKNHVIIKSLALSVIMNEASRNLVFQFELSCTPKNRVSMCQAAIVS